MVSIPLSKPCLGEEEKQAVNKVLDSGFLAQGENVKKFEDVFSRYIGVKEAIATSSGTTALFVALKALGVKEKDRVITTPFTFVATASSILQCGGVPVFCDVDEKTFNLDPEKLENILKTEKNIKGVVAVHLYGLPCNLEEITFLTKKYNIFLLEDCAQAHGAEYQDKKVGSWGDMGAFSFYPTKNMTTGEGGMITTNDSLLAEKCRILINHGSRKRYYHEMLGYNFRLTDIGGALGRVQLTKLEKFNEKRRENAAFYNRELSSLPSVAVPFLPPFTLPVFHQYTLRIKEGRDALLQFLRNKGIGCEIYYPLPLHRQPFLQDLLPASSFSVAESLSREVLSLPVHPQLTEEDLYTVAEGVREFFLNY